MSCRQSKTWFDLIRNFVLYIRHCLLNHLRLLLFSLFTRNFINRFFCFFCFYCFNFNQRTQIWEYPVCCHFWRNHRRTLTFENSKVSPWRSMPTAGCTKAPFRVPTNWSKESIRTRKCNPSTSSNTEFSLEKSPPFQVCDILHEDGQHVAVLSDQTNSSLRREALAFEAGDRSEEERVSHPFDL